MARKHGQRGQCIKRGEKAYLLRVPLGRDDTGKRRYRNEMFYGLKKDALERLTDLLKSKDTGLCIEPSKASLDTYLDRWLDTMTHHVGLHTHADYVNLMRRYVRPVLGKQPLGRITPLDVEELYTGMVERGLSRAITYTHATLKQAFEHAVKLDLLARNPAAKVRPPRPATSRKSNELRVFTREQVETFLDAAQTDRLGAMFLLALNTGMRPSEYFGLQWPDLDCEHGKLKVHRTLIPYGPSKWSFGEPKTAAGRRTIDLPPTVVRALHEHRRAQAAERLRAGPDWTPHDLVFCTPTGGPLDLHNVKRDHLKRILTAAGLPGYTLYSLRHSHATLSLAEGVNVKTVSERLGHADIRITLQTYAHVLPTMQQAAVDVWEKLSSGR